MLLAIVGGVLLYFTVRRVGWADVQSSVRAIGWWFAAVVLLGGVRFAVRARAWMVCSQPAPLRFREAVAAILVGDALGNLTPLGLLASEPAKVLIVKDRISTINAVASVATENAFYTASVLGMLAAGTLMFFEIATVPAPLQVAAEVVLGGAFLAVLGGVWVMRRQPALLTRLARVVASVTGRAATSADRLRQIEVNFYTVLMWPERRIAKVLLWEALFHVAAVLEVYLALQAISATTLGEAFVLETTGRFIVVVFKFVPYRLGVDEAGTALVARALGLDPTLGVTLALVRRLRIVCWNAVGLITLAAFRSKHEELRTRT